MTDCTGSSIHEEEAAMAKFGQQGLYIHGRPASADSAETFSTLNPATGEILAEVCQASSADIDRAVASAHEGQRVWAGFTAMQRSRVLRRAVEILRARNDELAELETFDTGKPLERNPVRGYRHRRRRAGILRRPRSASKAAGPLRTSPSSIRGGSRWAWSPVSAPGTIRSRSPCGNRPRRWPPATR